MKKINELEENLDDFYKKIISNGKILLEQINNIDGTSRFINFEDAIDEADYEGLVTPSSWGGVSSDISDSESEDESEGDRCMFNLHQLPWVAVEMILGYVGE